MNRFHRLVWNRALRVLQVASELAHATGSASDKGAEGCPRRPGLTRTATALALLACLGSPVAWGTTPPGSGGGSGDLNNSTDGAGGANGAGGGGGYQLGGYNGSPASQGSGGAGGSGSAYNQGGQGGAGGAAGSTVSSTTVIATAINGANGGAGIGATVGGGAGGGGGGGAAIYVMAGSVTLTISGSITGGMGGDGGAESTSGNNYGGGGGGGGSGVVFASGGTLINSGSITGGNGGTGGDETMAANGVGGGGGGGGHGVSGANLTIQNSGSIAGGAKGDAGGGKSAGAAGTAGAAVQFTGGNNTLNLATGSVLDGVVWLTGGANATVAAQNAGLDLGSGILLDSGTGLTLDTTTAGLGVSGGIDGDGNVTIQGANTLILGTVKAASLTAGNGGLTLNGDVTTTGAQTYNTAVTLGADSTLTSTGDAVVLGSTVDGAHRLGVSANGTLDLSSAVGATTALTSLTTNSDAFTASADVNINGPLSVTTAAGSIQQVGGTFTVNGASTFNAGSNAITLTDPNLFLGAVNLTGGTTQITNAGNLTLGSLNTGALTVNSMGALNLGGGNISGNLSATSNGAVSQINGLHVAGNTTIDAGSGGIVLTHAGNDFSGTVSAIGADIAIAASNNLTIGSVTGSGPVSLSGASGLTLDGDVSTPGMLTLSSDGAIGQTAGAINASTLTGTATGDVALTGTANSVATVGNLSTANVSLADSRALTVTGVLNASGNVVFNDNSGVTVTGAINAASTTWAMGGTLTIGNGGTSGSITGNVTDNGTLAFDRSDAVSFAGMISGPGALMQNGGGTLELTGTNSYTGGTTISAGTLQGDTSSLQGNITDDANLVFDQATAGIYAGAISGSGALSKTGAGTLTFNGSSPFSGATTVTRGKLVVGDDSHAGASLGGRVTVAAGATLGGIGTIGGLNLAGTVTPGNSIGTLRVAGDATFQPGSSYLIEAAPNGASDQIAATGKVTILGGSAAVLAQAGNWAPRTDYTIITGAQGVSGKFVSVSSSLLFLQPVLSYGANAVSLSLQRNKVSFASITQTPNQRAVATVTDGLGFASPMYSALTTLDATTARHAFDQLSGVIHASTRTALIDDSRYVREAINRHLLGQNDDTEGTTAADASAWASVRGHGGHHDDDGNAASLRANGSGLLVGADLSLGSNSRLGAVVGHGQNSIRESSLGSSAHVLGDQVGLYGSSTFGAFALRGGVAYARQDVDSHRPVAFGSYNDRLSGGHHAQTAQAYVEGGFQFNASPDQRMEPFVNLARVRVHSDALQEDGGNAALAVAGNSASVNTATLGLRDTLALDAAGGIHAHASLAYQQAWGDLTPIATMHLATGGNSFAVAGMPLARQAWTTDLGLDFKLTRNVGVDASYLGHFANGLRDQGARMRLTVTF